MGLSVRHFLIAGWHGRAQLSVGGTIPRQLGLGCIRKQAVQARRSKPVRNIPPWLLFQFLFPGPCLEPTLVPLDDGLEHVNQINPSLPVLLMVVVFITAMERRGSTNHFQI